MLLTKSHEMQHLLGGVRTSVLSSSSELHKVARSKLKYLEGERELFGALSQASTLIVALTQSKEIEASVQELLTIYNDIKWAAYVLEAPAGLEDQKIIAELEPILNGQNDDEIELRLQVSISVLKDLLSPMVQLK